MVQEEIVAGTDSFLKTMIDIAMRIADIGRPNMSGSVDAIHESAHRTLEPVIHSHTGRKMQVPALTNRAKNR